MLDTGRGQGDDVRVVEGSELVAALVGPVPIEVAGVFVKDSLGVSTVMPSLAKTASKVAVNFASRSRKRWVKSAARSPGAVVQSTGPTARPSLPGRRWDPLAVAVRDGELPTA
jgi:hypothetical protein